MVPESGCAAAAALDATRGTLVEVYRPVAHLAQQRDNALMHNLFGEHLLLKQLTYELNVAQSSPASLRKGV